MLRPVVRLPSKEGEQDIEVEVVEMTREHRRWWDAHVQPEVAKVTFDGQKRADCDWSWVTIAKAEAIARQLRQRPQSWTLCARIGAWSVPIGMLLVVGNYHHFVREEDLRSPSVFVWYLSDAPAAVFEKIAAGGAILEEMPGRPSNGAATPRVGQIRRIAKALLDLAVSWSVVLGEEGRILLHAAPAGGARLARWYTDQGLSLVPSRIRMVAPTRSNDGRYSFHSGKSAKVFRAQSDRYR